MKKILKIIIIAMFFFLIQSLEVNASDDVILKEDDYNSKIVNKLYDLKKIPAKFNLKDKIDIFVSDQGLLGLCELFATVKSIETNYALNSNKSINVSERYIDYMTSKDFLGDREVGIVGTEENDYTWQDGDGISLSEIIDLARINGLATEDEVQYNNYEKEEILNAKEVIRVKRTIQFPNLKDSNTELKKKWLNVMKAHIMKYGSLEATIEVPGINMNWDTNALITVNRESYGDHAISIVGWDDNYSKDNFLDKPQNNGAFICLNSWGEYHHDNGYFYVSYEDVNIWYIMFGILETEDYIDYNQYTYNKKIDSFSDDYFDGFDMDKHIETEFYVKFQKNEKNEKLERILFYMDCLTSGKVYINNKNDNIDSEDDFIYLGDLDPYTSNWYGYSLLTIKKDITLPNNSFIIKIKYKSDNNIVRYAAYNEEPLKSNNTYVHKENKYDQIYDIPIYVFTEDVNSKLPYKSISSIIILAIIAIIIIISILVFIIRKNLGGKK